MSTAGRNVNLSSHHEIPYKSSPHQLYTPGYVTKGLSSMHSSTYTSIFAAAIPKSRVIELTGYPTLRIRKMWHGYTIRVSSCGYNWKQVELVFENCFLSLWLLNFTDTYNHVCIKDIREVKLSKGNKED